MSGIDVDRWRELSSFLDEALELPGTERLAWLDALRATQPQVAEALQSLLAQLENLESCRFLEDDPVQLLEQQSLSGQILGAYTLEKAIGHGGMGSVWLARRSDGRFEGKVAVKLLNIALIGRGGEERFRREGRVLARLTHANIARILDAGVTSSGQPYLVLEYIEGSPIDRYCNEHALGLEARLRLFLDVLTAVGHAHANLVVHRDIKPSNILVTTQGVVKLLDFGIAKLIEDDTRTDAETALTQDGGRALTPEYAAPEQVLSAPITVATDVYSLGVLLYILLSGGRHPTSTGATSTPQLMRALLETEPQPVSTAVTDRMLERALRGDLDNIAAKALKKSPPERYSSVKEFADDLRRYLRNEPVLARADNPWYRVRKFVARNRLPVGIAAAALVGIIATAALALFEAHVAEIGRDRALTLSSRNEEVADFLETLITDAASAEKTVSVRGMLDRSEATIRKEYQQDPQQLAVMLDVLADYYASNDAPQRGESLLREALSLITTSPDEELRRKFKCDRVLALSQSGRAPEAIQEAKSVIAERDLTPEVAARCLEYLGETYIQQNDGRHAREYLEGARQRLLEVRHPRAGRLAGTLAMLGHGEYLEGHNDVADRYYAQAMVELGRAGRDHDWFSATILGHWAIVSTNSGNPRHALEQYDRAMSIFAEGSTDSATRPTATYNRARTLEQLGRLDEANDGFVTCAAEADELHYTLGSVFCRTGLVSVAVARGELTLAESYLANASALAGTPVPANFPAAPRIEILQSVIAMKEGRLQEARTRLDALIGRGTAAPITFDVLRARSELNLQEGKLSAGEADARRMLALAQQAQGSLPHSDRTGIAWLLLGQMLAQQADAPRARGAYQRAIENLANTVDADHPLLLRARQLAGPE